MKIIKKPTQKDLVKVGKSLTGFELGRRLSNGVVGLNLIENPTYAKLGITALALIGAAAYAGPQKAVVQAALVGMAAQQGGSLLTEKLRTSIERNPDASKVEGFFYDVAGLNGACGCPGNGFPTNQFLGAPEVAGIINMEFNKGENHYEAMGA